MAHDFLRIAIAVALLLVFTTSQARDNGQFAQVSPDIRDWFRGLTSKRGSNCCDGADGVHLDDPDWRQVGEDYQVFLNGAWIDVPPSAVVDGNNKVGYAILWSYVQDGKTVIRCFLAGTLS